MYSWVLARCSINSINLWRMVVDDATDFLSDATLGSSSGWLSVLCVRGEK